MMFNETLLLLLYSLNLMASPLTTNIQKDDMLNATTITTTTIDPAIEYDDEWYMWRCYPPFGCFYIGSPWSGGHRPVSMFPEKPESIRPIFKLYTRKTVNSPHSLLLDNYSSITESPIRPKDNFYFLIHGYLDNGNKTWILKMMRELLIRDDVNVVIVSWIGGAGPPYTQAVANTRLVGAMLGRLASQIIQTAHVQPSRVHCIGHSLGAHTCGYLGYNLRVQYGHKLGRITGLDPAEPHFSNTPPVVRLDPTDATFVTAIHTDCNPFISGGLGISQPVAHIDFFPNGGKNQPGCNEGVFHSITMEKGSLFRGLKRFLGCNHIRSYEYFTESINTVCPFLSVPCASWEKFQEGGCFDCVEKHCPRFGFNAQPENYHASVYLMTGKDKPYCRAHYHVTINISSNNESMNYGGEVGMFSIRVVGVNKKITKRIVLNESSIYYEPGSNHSAVVSGEVVGRIDAVELTWEYQTQMFNPLTWRVNKPKAYIDSLTIKSLEFNEVLTLCPRDSKPLVANDPYMLKVQYCLSRDQNLVAT